LRHITQTSNFQQALHRRTLEGALPLNPIGKFSMEVAVGKSLCRHHAAQNVLRSGTVSWSWR